MDELEAVRRVNVAGKYQVKLSVLLESVEYCSDVESDGYYVVNGTNEIIAYGEDLSDEYIMEDEVWTFLESNECLKLPTLHEIDNFTPDWNRNITLKYIDVMIEDEKQKKILTKAYKSIFGNQILPAFPGSTKFNKELGKLGRMEEWNQFIRETYKAHQLEFVKLWCQEHNVEIVYDA